MKSIQNWSKQYSCQPKTYFQPQTESELIQQLNSNQQTIRVLGSACSPSDIAMSDECLLGLQNMNRVLNVDVERQTVSVQGGVTLNQLNPALAQHGLAMPNLGSISEQTLAGAIATGTHGTGLGFGSIASQLESATLITAQGEKKQVTRDTTLFNGLGCHLGSLGILSELTLNVCPAFDLEIQENPNSLTRIFTHLEQSLKQDHYRFWVLPHTNQAWEWQAKRINPGSNTQLPGQFAKMKNWYKDTLVGFHFFQFLLYLGRYQANLIPAINNWFTRRFFNQAKQSVVNNVQGMNFDCLFSQHVNEWSIPIEHTEEAITRLQRLIDAKGYKVHLPIEVRFVKGDNFWLSPCQGRDSCYIGVIMYRPYGREVEYQAYFRDYESIMASLGGRPHWAKRFAPQSEQLSTMYPFWQDFQTLRQQMDPLYLLRNNFTDRVFKQTT